MQVTDTHDLFVYELQQLYAAERDLVDALDGLVDETTTDALDYLPEKEKKQRLADLFEAHRDVTETHVERLEAVFEALDLDPEPRADPIAEGAIRDKDRFNNVVLNDELRCPYYLRTGTLVERLEISGYEHLLRLADQLDFGEDVTEPLESTLAEERDALDRIEELVEPLHERAIKAER